MREQLCKDLEVTPPREAFINRVPVTVLAGQESPLRAGASDPQDGFKETTYIASGSEPYLGTGFQDGQNLLPLVIGELNCHHVEQFSFFASTQPRGLFFGQLIKNLLHQEFSTGDFDLHRTIPEQL